MLYEVITLRDMVRAGGAKTVAEGVPRLREELAHMPQIAALLVIDADGRVLARTGPTPGIDPGPSYNFV